jgi:hypothetical protein
MKWDVNLHISTFPSFLFLVHHYHVFPHPCQNPTTFLEFGQLFQRSFQLEQRQKKASPLRWRLFTHAPLSFRVLRGEFPSGTHMASQPDYFF